MMMEVIHTLFMEWLVFCWPWGWRAACYPSRMFVENHIRCQANWTHVAVLYPASQRTLPTAFLRRTTLPRATGDSRTRAFHALFGQDIVRLFCAELRMQV
jgi:hypothetical protein